MGSHQVSNFRHGFSKSQMCLRKILQIISSCPSPQATSEESSSIPQILEFEENRGVGIDLNMELFPSPQVLQSECLSASHDSVVDFMAVKISSEGECYHHKSIQEIGEFSGDINAENKQVKDKEKEDYFPDEGVKASPPFQEGEKKHNINDCFSLLVEAAEVVSGNLKEKEAKESESVKSGGVPLPAEEDISPVVRSKRGRSQVLPSRYRDSVIEPWKRQPRPQRPPAAAAAAAPIVSPKREGSRLM